MFYKTKGTYEKSPFWDFRLDWLWPSNFHFGCWPKSTNHVILDSAHSISKLKIDPERFRSREFMVRNPFLGLECYTSVNPCDSSPPSRAKIRPVTSEKFLKHFIFSPNSSIFFRILIEVTFLFFNIEKYALGLEQRSWAQVRKFLSHEDELVFEKILSVESILSHFFIQFWFSCVNLTDQIFMSFLFHTKSRDLKHDTIRNPRLISPEQINQLTLLSLRRQFSTFWEPQPIRHWPPES